MNKSETAILLGDLARYDLRRFGDDDVLAWQEALHDVAYENARSAVVAYYRDHRDRAMPSDIRKAAQLAADDRAAHASWSGDGGAGCGLSGCRCTHTTPCDRGWIDASTIIHEIVDHKTGEVSSRREYDAVQPCPICKPARVVNDGESRDAWLGRLRSQNMSWQSRQRQGAA